eukprot:TRINITY_DN4621_c1_g1_i2.p1 TRINITY_DN4621_c1_g1~~TRINITY_DN4621_c1_g1_i2.p1  ORF type:complete len:158 (-),score=34.43 TRINITY_DN4621_c1_g1_i2:495-968(-)
MRRISFGWMVAKRLNLLDLPSLVSARMELLDVEVTKTRGLLDINGSICEPTTLTTSFLDASSASCSSRALLSMRLEPFRERAFVSFGLPGHLSWDCTKLSISKITLAVLSVAVHWLSIVMTEENDLSISPPPAAAAAVSISVALKTTIFRTDFDSFQ